jgi:hypothetical protein
MRDQVERTVSAFGYYKSSIDHPNDSLDLVFGTPEARLRLAHADSAPLHLRRGPVGRYAYTAILTTVAGLSEDEADRAIDEFIGQSFAQRVLYESKVHRSTKKFPPLSILLHSQYHYFLHQLFEIVDPRRVMLVTLGSGVPVGAIISDWLGESQLPVTFPYRNFSRMHSAEVIKAREFCAAVLGDEFDSQSREIGHLANAVGCHHELFSESALFHRE